MPEPPDAEARTRAFARVIGPYVAIATAIIIWRAPAMDAIFSDFFENRSIVWMTGGMLLLGGLIIIACHQYWRSLAAVLVSLFGWFLALRGVVLMAAPQWIESGGNAAVRHTFAVRLGFGVLTVIGLYLTYAGWISNPRPREAKAP